MKISINEQTCVELVLCAVMQNLFTLVGVLPFQMILGSKTFQRPGSAQTQVFDTGRAMASSALNLDAVREGYRWLALQNPQGHSIPRCGLLVKVQFLETGSCISSGLQSSSPTLRP